MQMRFHGVLDSKLDVSFAPYHDRVEFLNVTDVFFDTDNLPAAAGEANQRTLIFDSWVYLDDIGGIQTICWLGDPETDPDGDAPDANVMQYWIRLSEGRPQFVVGSDAGTDSSSGASGPTDGFYIAFTDQTIPFGEQVHIRWIFESAFS